MNSFEIHGEWLLGDSEKWKTGTLRFSQEQGVRLELVHTKPIDYSSPITFQFILGKTGDGNVTLINCRNRHSQTWYHNNLSFQVFTAQCVFIGSHYNNLIEIEFEKVQFNLHNLSDWINTWGLKYSTIPSENKFSLKYSVPDSIEFNINDECLGKINFECTTNFTADNERTVTIKESHEIELIYHNAKNFEKILEDITKFQNLLSVFIYEQSFPLYIKFFNLKEDNQEQTVKLYHQHANYKINTALSQNQIIFFKSLNNNFNSVIIKWFEQYEKIQSALFLFLSLLKEKASFQL